MKIFHILRQMIVRHHFFHHFIYVELSVKKSKQQTMPYLRVNLYCALVMKTRSCLASNLAKSRLARRDETRRNDRNKNF